MGPRPRPVTAGGPAPQRWWSRYRPRPSRPARPGGRRRLPLRLRGRRRDGRHRQADRSGRGARPARGNVRPPRSSGPAWPPWRVALARLAGHHRAPLLRQHGHGALPGDAAPGRWPTTTSASPALHRSRPTGDLLAHARQRRRAWRPRPSPPCRCPSGVVILAVVASASPAGRRPAARARGAGACSHGAGRAEPPVRPPQRGARGRPVSATRRRRRLAHESFDGARWSRRSAGSRRRWHAVRRPGALLRPACASAGSGSALRADRSTCCPTWPAWPSSLSARGGSRAAR